jgi:hypothetical protein
MKLESIVRHFQNNNEEYVKIRNTVEQKVIGILSDRRMVLKLALLSLIESMRKDSYKYSSLIYQNTPQNAASTGYSSDQYYGAASSGQQQYLSWDCIDMLLDEAEKLYNKLTKEMVNTTITDYASSILSSLPMLSQSDEKEQQSHPRQTTATNQSYMHTEEHKFIRSEIDEGSR